MSDSEKNIDHGAAFTAPRKTAPGLFEEDPSGAQGLSADAKKEDDRVVDGGDEGGAPEGMTDAGNAEAESSVAEAGRRHPEGQSLAGGEDPVPVQHVATEKDAKPAGLLRQDEEFADERAPAPVGETAPEVGPQTRPGIEKPAGFAARAIEPVRAWIFSGKSPFDGLVGATGKPAGTATPVAEPSGGAVTPPQRDAAVRKPAVVPFVPAFVLEQPLLTAGGAVAALAAILVAVSAANNHAPAVEANAPVQQFAQIPSPPPPPPQPVAKEPVRDEILKALEDIDRRLKNVEAEQQRIGAFGGRVANIEAATASMRAQMEASASPQGEIEALRHGLDEVRGVAASLAENMDERLTKLGSVSSMPAAAPVAAPIHRAPPARRHKRAVRSSFDDSALPAMPESDPSSVVGTATGSPTRGFILAPADKIDVAKGDILPGYGRVESVSPAQGGKMVITENGTIFVRTGNK